MAQPMKRSGAASLQVQIASLAAGIAFFMICCRFGQGDSSIVVQDVRRDFFSEETAELTSVSVALDDRAASTATLLSGIESAAATIARASQVCHLRDGKWSGAARLAVPRVDRRISGNLLLRVVVNDRVLARTVMPIHLYPPRNQFKRSFDGRRFLVLDPNRSLEPILRSNGIAFSAIETWQLAQSPNLPLLIGRDAMSNWSRSDAGHWRTWLQNGGQAVVFAQRTVPIQEFEHGPGKARALPSNPVLMVFHTPLALALYDSAPQRWQPSGLPDAAPLPLPRAKDFWVLALAEPFEPDACCRAVEVLVGQGRAIFTQYPIDKCYENEPGARVLWEALLEEALRPISECQLVQFKSKKENER
jgi:hypothetical protein